MGMSLILLNKRAYSRSSVSMVRIILVVIPRPRESRDRNLCTPDDSVVIGFRPSTARRPGMTNRYDQFHVTVVQFGVGHDRARRSAGV
jgi:hypothetical protein